MNLGFKFRKIGFVPSTIEITDPKRGNTFLNFGDFECFNPPFPTGGTIIVSDFKNYIDLLRIREALQDEGSVPKSTLAHLHIASNPFAILEHLQDPSLMLEKTKEVRNPTGTALIALEFEKSSLLG